MTSEGRFVADREREKMKYDRLSAYNVAVIVCLIFIRTQWVGYTIAHFIDEKTEFQTSYLP